MAAKNKDIESSGLGSKVKLSTSSKLFYILAYVSVGLMALICIIPFIVLISGSFNQGLRSHIQGSGYSISCLWYIYLNNRCWYYLRYFTNHYDSLCNLQKRF